jgi:putative transposase
MARKSKFKESEIVYALKQVEAGVPLKEMCRKLGVAEQTFYRWRTKYGGLSASELQRLKQLEEENRQLKKLVADLSLDKHVLQEVLSKKV